MTLLFILLILIICVIVSIQNKNAKKTKAESPIATFSISTDISVTTSKRVVEFEAPESEYTRLTKNLSSDLIKIISESDGILQKEICKMYDDKMKTYIRMAIKELAKTDKITMEKSGNSYMLRIKK